MIGTKLGRGGRPLRIAYGRLFHEANARSPLLTEREDREKLVTLFRRLFADERVRKARPTAEELAIVVRIGESLDAKAAPPARKAVVRRAPSPAAKKRASKKKA